MTTMMIVSLIFSLIWIACLTGSIFIDKNKVSTTNKNFRIIKRTLSSIIFGLCLIFSLLICGPSVDDFIIIIVVAIMILNSGFLFINIKIKQKKQGQ